MRLALLCLALAAPLLAGEDEIAGLDPSRDEDRARLIALVEEGAGAEYRAARKLAKAGHVEPLLELLKTTDVFNAMQAITATVGARSVPVMQERLARDPDNAYLVGSLAPRTDPRVTKLALRALGSHERLTARAAAHMLIWAVDVDGLLAELRRRFEAATHEKSRAKLAMCLIRRGDTTPAHWMRERLRDGSREVLEALVFVANANMTHPFEDASILAPLLPDLIALLGSERPQAARDARRLLVRLTRLDLGETEKPWRLWYDRNNDRPRIYTRALDDAIRSCAEAFRDAVHARDRNHWCSTDSGTRDGRDAYVWRVTNPPALAVSTSMGLKWEDGTPVEQPRFPIGLYFALQTNAEKLPDQQLEVRFDRINVVVRLRLSKGGKEEERKAVIAAARKACEGLARYEKTRR